MSGKPIIFIKPLSENVQKLRDTISADEAFSIYEIESTAEYNQLAPQLGASLTICSDLKKIAKILSDNKAHIKKHGCKSLLISGEKLPFAITDKVQKLGLSEILYEPIVPKTLLYKVTFLCKSLKTVEDKKHEDVVIKSMKQEKDGSETKLDEKDKQQAQIAEEIKAREEKKQNDLKPDSNNKNLSMEASNDKFSELSGKINPTEPEAPTSPKAELEKSDVQDELAKKKKDFNLALADDEATKKKEEQKVDELNNLKSRTGLADDRTKDEKKLNPKAQTPPEENERKKTALEELAEFADDDQLAPQNREKENKSLPERAREAKLENEKKEKENKLADIAEAKEKKERELAKPFEKEEKEAKEREALALNEIEQRKKKENVIAEKIEKEKKEKNKLELEELDPSGIQDRKQNEIEDPKAKREREKRQLTEAREREKRERQLNKEELSDLKSKPLEIEDVADNLKGKIGPKKKEEEEKTAHEQKEKSKADDEHNRKKDFDLQLEDENGNNKKEKNNLNKNKPDRQRDFDLALDDDPAEKKKAAKKENKKPTKDLHTEDQTPELNLKKKFKDDVHEMDLELKEIPQVPDNNWDYDEQGKEEEKVEENLGEQTIDYSEFEEYEETSLMKFAKKQKKKAEGSSTADELEMLSDPKDSSEGSYETDEEANEDAYSLNPEDFKLNPKKSRLDKDGKEIKQAKIGPGELKLKKDGSYDEDSLSLEKAHSDVEESSNEEQMEDLASLYEKGETLKKDSALSLDELNFGKKAKKEINIDTTETAKAQGKAFEEVATEKDFKKTGNSVTDETKTKTKSHYVENEESAKVLPFKAINQAPLTAIQTPPGMEEIFIIDAPIIKPQTKGLEYIIGVQRLLQKPNVNPQELLEYIAEKLLTRKNAFISYYEYQQGEHILIYSSHEAALDIEVYLGTSWYKLSQENQSIWESKQIPEWKDETFVSSLNEFIYPFYEGDNRLGYAVVHSFAQIKDIDDASLVEIMVESLRSIYLARYEINNMIDLQEVQLKKMAEENTGIPIIKVIKGFFKKLFGMAA